ncbi:bola protein [Cytidiella melzeri]|nr:bola protein [Cytidiella melzeri]
MYALLARHRFAHIQPGSVVHVALRRGYASRKLSEGEQNITNKLQQRFSPTELAVQDVSGGCGSFYAISITSDAFKDLPTVKQHRLVNDTLKKEIQGIHGLQVSRARCC